MSHSSVTAPYSTSAQRLLGREGRVLRVQGVDMLDGTPSLDIKPYLSNVPEAELRRGWMDKAKALSKGWTLKDNTGGPDS